jgi:hypothetical protein
MRAVELYLAEYTNGHRPESELRTLLGGLLGTTLTANSSTAESWSNDDRPLTVGRGLTQGASNT